MIFFAPGTLVDPPLAPTVRGPGCPPAPPSDHWYGGLGGSLGDSEAGKPQKVGACGWLKMGPNHLFEHPEWSWITFGKTRFSPIFDAFLGPKRPIFKAFWDFPWPKTRQHGLKTA